MNRSEMETRIRKEHQQKTTINDRRNVKLTWIRDLFVHLKRKRNVSQSDKRTNNRCARRCDELNSNRFYSFFSFSFDELTNENDEDRKRSSGKVLQLSDALKKPPQSSLVDRVEPMKTNVSLRSRSLRLRFVLVWRWMDVVFPSPSFRFVSFSRALKVTERRMSKYSIYLLSWFTKRKEKTKKTKIFFLFLDYLRWKIKTQFRNQQLSASQVLLNRRWLAQLNNIQWKQIQRFNRIQYR